MARCSGPLVAFLPLAAWASVLLSSCTGVAGAAAAERPRWTWERQVLFVQALATRQFDDIAERVVARLDADERIVGIERAFLNRRLATHYADLAPQRARERGLQPFLDALDQARARYRRFLGYPAIQAKPDYADARLEAQLALCRISLAMAEAVARQRDAARTPDADRPALARRADELHRTAVADFSRAADGQSKAVARLRSIEPQGDEALRRAWRRRLRVARERHFRVRLERSIARRRFAASRKQAKAAAKDWQPPLAAAEKDLRSLLLEFPGTPGAVQANLELARCLLEQGPAHDAEALERLSEVWRKRVSFARYSRIPCEAAELEAGVLLRQRKPADAVAVIDALLAVLSDGAWDPEQRTATLIATVLDALPEESHDEVARRGAARALLIQAEAFALLGKQAADAGKPRAEVRRAYGHACTTATGVLRVQRYVAPRYTPLLLRWLKEARRPAPPELLWQQYAAALDAEDYRAAAGFLSQIASQQTLLARDQLAPAEKRKLWLDLATCYHAAAMTREAAYAYLAVARWFPNAVSRERDPVASAIGVAAAWHQEQASPLSRRFLEWVQEQADALRPGTGAVAVRRAVRLRQDGKLRQALDVLAEVRPEQEAYPHALYETAATWRALALEPVERPHPGPSRPDALRAMEAAFGKLYALYPARRRELAERGEADARRQLLEIVAAALATHSDVYLRHPAREPDRVLALTADLPRRFPDVEQATRLPLILFHRLRAACALVPEARPERIDPLLHAIDDAWQTLRQAKGFAHRGAAAALAARACLSAAQRLAATDAARARRCRDRGLAFYLELLDAEPDQPVRTYAYVLSRLKARTHEPKSADWRAIARLAPHAVERFGADPRAAPGLLGIRITLGVALHALGKHREAVGVLEPIDDQLDEALGRQRRDWRQRLDEWGQRRHGPRPSGRPAHTAQHIEAKQTLAACYLDAARRDRYERALEAYALLKRLYDARPERYAPVLHGLCDTLARLGRYEDAARAVSLALHRPPAYAGGQQGRRRLRGVVARMKTAVGKLQDTRRRAELEPFLDQLLERLRQ